MCTISHKAAVAFKDSASVADMLLGPLEVDGMREIIGWPIFSHFFRLKTS